MKVSGQGDRDKEYWIGGPLKSIRRSQWSGHVLANEEHRLVLRENPKPCLDPPYQNGTMAKDGWWVRKVYWRRERAHDMTEKRVVFVVCTAGAFIW